MENNETKTLWISVGAALFAVFLLYSWSQEQKASFHKKFGSKQQVITATVDINEMQIIDESMLEVSERPVDFIQPGAIKTPDVAIGQMAAAPIKKGEQILDTKLLLPSGDTGLSRQVTPGKRAIAIPVDETRGVGKLVKPGDRIDIVIAVDSGQGQEKKREIRTLMQDVPVLATGQHIVDSLPVTAEEDGKDNYLITNLRKVRTFSSITIEASPNEVQNLVYILTTNPGSLYTVLRNPNDSQKSVLRTISSTDVLGRVRAPKKEAPPPPKPAPKKRVKPPKRGAYEEL